jgi:para-aminobenzoate synthetase component I
LPVALARPSTETVGQAEVEDGVHHAGHGDGGAGAHGDEQRVSSSPNFLPVSFSRVLMFDALRPSALGQLCRRRRCSSGAGFGGDGEAGRNGQADGGHLREVGALAAEQLRVLVALTGGADRADGEWMIMLSYDLGCTIEPVAQHAIKGEQASDDRQWPLIALAWCPDRIIVETSTGEITFIGRSDAIAEWIDRDQPGTQDFKVQPLASSFSAASYMQAVQRVIEYIAAGDIFQANLTQRFTAPFAGSTRELARRAFLHSRPRYGAYLELPGGRAIVSMSPELFLDVDGDSRTVITRPIKGTRPATHPRAASELQESIKDQAELNMIVDLMRNDIGRVCEFGSVQVTQPREIETHPTVHHGVATIRGRLRETASLADLLRATFPGGSITGAPKIRAMQIIDEIEPVRRGPYCGSLGWLNAAGSARLNIAIRTISLSGNRLPGVWGELDGVLDYGAGGGIVADSDPMSEYRESIDKAAVLRMTLQKRSPAVSEV